MPYNGKYMHDMGRALEVMGFFSIALGIVADATFASMGYNWETFHYISAPIWNGVFVVITGILAINSGKKPTSKGLMIAVMVLGICTILTALGCFSLAIVGSIDAYYEWCLDGTSLVLHVMIALLTLPEIVMAFAAAIMPCWGLESTNNPNGLPVVVYNQLQEGPDIAPGQAAYLILPTDAQGAVGGMSQQQVPVFIAQHPYAADAPMKRNYGTMAPPP